MNLSVHILVRLQGEVKHLFQRLRVCFITVLAHAVHDLQSLFNSKHIKNAILKRPL